MPFMPAPKTFLFPLFLSLIQTGAQAADKTEAAGVYRFGEWTLVAPAIAKPSLTAGTHTLQLPSTGLELLFYWKEGDERALAVRFNGEDAKEDVSVLRSRFSTERLKGCRARLGGRIKSMDKVRPAEVEAVELPDDTRIIVDGSERGLVRYGETLAFDLGTHRVQITQDSSIVRVGEWDSAKFCRFELKEKEDRDD